ncbi:MAG TPA: FAD-dependent oxidoreductase [Candidatus Ventrimonas merdavium]|nr:FAD-dependent oxidoreductase [Candidatus Ventrimonas merdavium]
MKKKRLLLTGLCVALSAAGCSSPTAETAAPETTAQETTVQETAAEGAGGGMKAGTYTASTQGMNDKVEVSVEVSEDAIISVDVTKESETPGIGGPLKNAAGEELYEGGKTPVTLIPEQIVEYQTLNVDAVTGATITSAAVKKAVEDCLTQAGANLDDWQAEVPAEAQADQSADVVVVGGGGAGLAAAISAAEGGASVVVVEKNGSVGGDTLVCGAIYNTPNEALQSQVTMTDAVKATIESALAEEPVDEAHAALQKEVQAQWDEYKASGRTDLFDTKEWYALQTWINGDKVADLDLVKTLCYDSYDGLEWIESLGMEFSDVIGQGAGALWQRTHTSTMQMGTGFMSTYVEQIAENDKITILTSSTAEKLVQDADGRVVGVVCKDKAGNEFTVDAGMGVVLATGGFAANSKMVQEYNTSGKWNDLSKVMTTNRFSSSQGDGITMALEAGAGLTDMEQIQLLYLGNVKDGQLTKYPPRDVNGTDQIIFINKEGERFVREDGRRDEICLAVMGQTDSMFYMLESADGPGYVDIADPEWRSADGFTFDYLEENGYILVADTLDEMAEKLGCDADTLKATVDNFNASVDGAADEFGRTLYTTKLENGPWVATARQACIHHTMGGVSIDTEARVLDESGAPIAGLYAAGEVTGGIHGANRLGGNAVVDTVVFGKLAGETVIADAK